MKKFFALLFVTVIAFIANSLFTIDAYAAEEISVNEPYTGTLTDEDDNHSYSFTLTEPGHVTIDITSYIDQIMYYKLSYENGTIESKRFRGGSINPVTKTISVDLGVGTYTLNLYDYYSGAKGDYEFSVQFEAALGAENEPNNGISQAEPLAFGEGLMGFIAWNDTDDYYEITVEKTGMVSLLLEGALNYFTHYQVLNDKNEKIASKFRSSSQNTPTYFEESFYLEPGVYYIRVYGEYRSHTGHYTLSVDFETSETTETGLNNGTKNAQPVEFGALNQGILTWNNKEDYFTFRVTNDAPTTLLANLDLEGYTTLEVLDSMNKSVWKSKYAKRSSAIEKQLNLTPGDYYLRIQGYYEGEYDFTLLGEGISSFKDYKYGAYWATPFAWGMKNNVIKGDLKANLLNPNNEITEAQWLAMLLRHAYKTKDATSGKWYDSYYKKAKELGIQTTGQPNASLTRGAVAKMLVTVYESKNVTEQQAVHLLYTKGITTGVNAALGQTFENFNPSGKLTRAHAITFMHRLYKD